MMVLSSCTHLEMMNLDICEKPTKIFEDSNLRTLLNWNTIQIDYSTEQYGILSL